MEKAWIDSTPHYRFDYFLTFHTTTFVNDRMTRCDVSYTLCACYKHTHAPAILSIIVFILMRFRRSTPIRCACVFVLIHFEVRFENDAFSKKRSAYYYAFSSQNALVWTGPESEILGNNYLVIACIKGVVNTGSSTDDKLETWKVTFTSSQVSCENKRQLYTYG